MYRNLSVISHRVEALTKVQDRIDRRSRESVNQSRTKGVLGVYDKIVLQPELAHNNTWDGI